MPLYEDENTTREDLDKIRRKSRCSVCGARLNMYFDQESGRAFVACWDWLRTHHEGIEREVSRYEKEGLAALNIPTRRKIMAEEHGEVRTKALARLPTTGALTQSQAMHILKLVYPEAPEDEIIRCALLCRDFGLHPLMKEVYLIPFKDKRGVDNYVTVLGIRATRKLVAQRGSYSYLDNTPRVMTEQEQKDIFGEVDAGNIKAITKLKTREGLEAQGYGSWPRNKEPYGTDKGNSKANMAFIRSERNAFGRLFTDAIPQGVEVIDEAYVDAPDTSKIIDSTGEIIEQEPVAPAPTAKEHWCEEHNCPFEKKVRGSSTWYAHKLPDGSWCNEAKKKAKGGKEAPREEANLAQALMPLTSELDFDPVLLTESLKQVHWSEDTLKSWCKNIYITSAKGEPLDIKMGLVEFVASLKREDREAMFKEIERQSNKE